MKIKINTELRVVTFKLDEDLLQKLDLYAVNARVTRSEVIREALKLFLSITVVMHYYLDDIIEVLINYVF